MRIMTLTVIFVLQSLAGSSLLWAKNPFIGNTPLEFTVSEEDKESKITPLPANNKLVLERSKRRVFELTMQEAVLMRIRMVAQNKPVELPAQKVEIPAAYDLNEVFDKIIAESEATF